jgi:DNA-binding NtrC family response regulator
VVASTNKRLADLVSEGRFRDDLYFRLSVVRVSIPPLCERREDVPYLIEHFVNRFNAKRGKQIDGLTPAAMELLMRHDFPGNVRELENIIEYAFVLCHGRLIDISHLPEELQAMRHERRAQASGPSKLESAESDAIRAAIDRAGGVLTKAAEELGIHRTSLWRKMRRHGLNATDSQPRAASSRTRR